MAAQGESGIRILCTNDDGFLATGLEALAAASAPLGLVEVVAPDREQSATSHSLTLHHPLRARRTDEGVHVVDGTPTDCVILAVAELLADPPDFCFSGINHGPNMGEDVLYSGTVAAAMEATVLGIPAVALSYAGDGYRKIGAWIPFLTGLLRRIVDQQNFPGDTLLNVNIPGIPPDQVRGVKVTHLGKRRFSDSMTRALDPSGKEYFWIGGGVTEWAGDPDSDYQAVKDGFVSVTPLHLDLTNYRLLKEIRSWDLES